MDRVEYSTFFSEVLGSEEMEMETMEVVVVVEVAKTGKRNPTPGILLVAHQADGTMLIKESRRP